MADVSPERINLQQEEVAYRSAVSEATFSRVAASVNFINYYQANMREFAINGSYGLTTVPFLGVDGIIRFPYNWELLDLYIWQGEVVGSGGQTELDVKWKQFSGGSYASIFSTTPKIINTASAFETCGIGQSKTGFIAPVLSKTLFAANDQLRIDLITSMTGNPKGCGIGIVFRPR